MKDLLFKGVLLAAAGGIATKAIKTVRYYKLEKEDHDEVIEDTADEK